MPRSPQEHASVRCESVFGLAGRPRRAGRGLGPSEGGPAGLGRTSCPAPPLGTAWEALLRAKRTAHEVRQQLDAPRPRKARFAACQAGVCRFAQEKEAKIAAIHQEPGEKHAPRARALASGRASPGAAVHESRGARGETKPRARLFIALWTCPCRRQCRLPRQKPRRRPASPASPASPRRSVVAEAEEWAKVNAGGAHGLES